ncbi:hypothetical protein [Streptomyces sp. ME19-01-6]|uniref:hypothetical protein n=1 Tax=Streptomyces sp. ME19-01-6 TaxID=3028686 RepID=UPI0029B97B6B|nr:hypothetical protein [Streptomyces sp. ME19-01-6]MDX3229676.1 hypothetical protein [Streptomyces sp. ME19-01-6]
MLPLGPDLPHTHPRPVHWLATAAALAAVVAGAAVLQPSDAKATTDTTTASAPGSGAPRAPIVKAPDPTAADYPVDCGSQKPDVTDRASGDLDGDGRPETVAVVRCHSETGTPPSGIYVLAQPDGKGSGEEAAGKGSGAGPGRPRIVATFLDPREGMSIKDFALRGTKISATLLGYSSEQVPRCCPDLQRKVNWQWKDGKFVLKALPVAGSV